MVHSLPGQQTRTIETLMDRAWPAVERHDTGEWVLRAAAGVTQRANSVWPREAAAEPQAALREAVQWYRKRRLPSIFQVMDTPAGPAAVGRLALVDGSGGIYCMATSPSRRRRGHASAVLQALLSEGDARGLANFWLLVTAPNHAARRLYSEAGFKESGRYVYRQQRPLRALTGC